MKTLLNEVLSWYQLYQVALIPFLIFLARVLDVSISTIRIMFVWAGNKYLATFLGFFEALVWIIAIGQIMKDISNITSYLAYAGGFAAGTFAGMLIEEKLAYGTSMIRIITKKPALELIEFLKSKKLGVTTVEAEGHNGKVHIIYTVLKRKMVKCITARIKEFNPNGFYTIENIKFANDPESLSRRNLKSLLSQHMARK